MNYVNSPCEFVRAIRDVTFESARGLELISLHVYLLYLRGKSADALFRQSGVFLATPTENVDRWAGIK
jgi:hypothetical protein